MQVKNFNITFAIFLGGYITISCNFELLFDNMACKLGHYRKFEHMNGAPLWLQKCAVWYAVSAVVISSQFFLLIQ